MSWREAMRATLENPTGFENTYFMTEAQEREAFGSPELQEGAKALSDAVNNAGASIKSTWWGKDKEPEEAEKIVIQDDMS